MLRNQLNYSCLLRTAKLSTKPGAILMKNATPRMMIGALMLLAVFTVIQSLARNSYSSSGSQEAKPAPDFSKNKWEIPADADKTKNPVEASDESIAKGKELYLTRKGNCVFCHGETGAGNEANLAKLRRKPADLTDASRLPKLSDGELYWKITKGITGIMPSYDDPKLTAEERWQLVNYIRTLAHEKPKP
jgi:mono/diheme cytochrome c family protein